MKLFGSLTELVATVFRKNSQTITLRPNQTTTYTASRDVQLPQQDANSIIVSRDSTDTLTNKTISGSSNTLTVLAGSQLSGQVPTANGGTGQNSTATFPTSGVVVTEAATETLTNKTINGASNTLTVLGGSQITGQVPTANGGTGQNSTATFPTSGVVVTEAATETLTNKTINGSSNTLTVLAGTQLSGQVPIANGGTGQATKAAGFDALSPLSTKGDVLSYSTTNARLPVGSDGQVITADSTQTLGIKWATPGGSTSQDSQSDATNYTLVTSVSSNALTIALKNKAGNDPSSGDSVNIAFRSSTAATGTYVMRSITAATSIVVSSGASLGARNSENGFIYVYALDNAGTVELAVSTSLIPEHSIQSTTAMSGSATSNTVFYSTTARTTKSVRLLARIINNQSTAGTYASNVQEIDLGTFFSPYKSKIVDLSGTITGNNSWVNEYAYGTAFEDGTGVWSVLFNVRADTSSVGSVTIHVNGGITFQMTQTLAGATNQSQASGIVGIQTDNSTDIITMACNISSIRWMFNGVLQVSGRPSWA